MLLGMMRLPMERPGTPMAETLLHVVPAGRSKAKVVGMEEESAPFVAALL
jgi:hypothetical protein